MSKQEEPKCVSMRCVYNDKLHKGLCIGISNHTRSYVKDVIRMCWVHKKPKLDATGIPLTECDINMQVQITPSESVDIGVALIQGSFAGKMLLHNMGRGEDIEKETKK